MAEQDGVSRICPRCSAENQAKARFCRSCGGMLEGSSPGRTQMAKATNVLAALCVVSIIIAAAVAMALKYVADEAAVWIIVAAVLWFAVSTTHLLLTDGSPERADRASGRKKVGAPIFSNFLIATALVMLGALAFVARWW